MERYPGCGRVNNGVAGVGVDANTCARYGTGEAARKKCRLCTVWDASVGENKLRASRSDGKGATTRARGAVMERMGDSRLLRVRGEVTMKRITGRSVWLDVRMRAGLAGLAAGTGRWHETAHYRR